MAQVSGPTAALAGIPAGLQAQGVWLGRRQLFVRFAAEAETATMYTADALAHELERSAARSAFHSISVSGRDPLSNVEYLAAVFDRPRTPLPVMLDCDGQRPELIGQIRSFLTLVQVTLEGANLDSTVDRVLQSVTAASGAKLRHGLVLCPAEQTSDAQLLRIVEQTHRASAETTVVIHPPAGIPVDRDRRWIVLVERAAGLHGNVRFWLKLPPPTGMR